MAIIRRWARRQFIINPRYQYRQILPVIVCLVAFASLAGLLVFLPLSRAVEADPNPGIQVVLEEQLLQIHLRLWPVLVLAGAIGGVYALQRSHKVAGPLYRLNQVMADIASGKDVKNVTFRAGDEFREFEELATNVSSRIRSVNARRRNMEGALLAVDKRVEELRRRFRDAGHISRQTVLVALESLQDEVYKHAEEARERRRGIKAGDKK